jgi:hypothetical protein
MEHDQLEIPERENAEAENFLVPKFNSPLQNSGVGGDLPNYIGFKGTPKLNESSTTEHDNR